MIYSQPERVRGHAVVATFKLKPCSGCMDSRIILLEIERDGRVVEYVTAQQNLGEIGWYWGHYFNVGSEGEWAAWTKAVEDFKERCKP